MDELDLDADPIAALASWLEEARSLLPQADAMALATSRADGLPSVRIVLLRNIDERGLTFFTNLDSRKGVELRANPRAALCFHWWELGRQVRVEGPVEELGAEESMAYWATRPRGSQIAARASRQSRPLTGLSELTAAVVREEARFVDSDVPLPSFWGGYRVLPESIEFWAHRENRLHDRIRYGRSGAGWERERLAP
ncbi:MAG TPA: pyridoxamine 5'-phosphate oxidase [Gaiellaceae bacterium]|nr:pyridoxamine 5'-phosphate oxidase [Gaiellaceae bacterium]